MKSNPQLHPNTLKFLRAIKLNNNKEWFDKNRDIYEEVKKNFYAFIEEFIKKLREFNPDIGPLDVKKCVYRINRDLRFSKDKSPYKNHMAASIARGGRKSVFAGYYFHIEPNGNSFIGGGVWRPEKDILNKVRQEIDYNQESFERIVISKSFVKTFGVMYDDKMGTIPKSYSKDNPAIVWLKYKSYIYGADIKDIDVLSKNALSKIVRISKDLSPFIHFLNTAISN